jgi:short-subunit dehydrogenase
MSKWAMVTGATAGIGESFTRILAREGFNIVLVARDLERMKDRAATLESQFNIQTAIVQADLATDDG